MIALSTAQVVRFSPPWRAREAAPPVYLLRAGSLIERHLLEADLAGRYDAAQVWPFEIEAELRAAALALMQGGDLDRLLDVIARETAGDSLDPVDQAIADALRRAARESWPAYRALTERQARREMMAPLLAFQQFCVGWENVDPIFSRGADARPPFELLALLPELELRAAGLEAYRLLWGRGHAKNSGAPSRSGATPETSPSASKTPGGSPGRSAAKAGRKTRG